MSVWVGGVSAQVLSATGNRVRFRVPATAPLGSTTVEAANPGAKKASIAFTVLGGTFSGNVQPVPDTSSAATATIGRDGGQIGAGGVTLRIPAGALTEPTAITVTPLLGLNGSPLQGQVVGATFTPDGLALLKPAILSFTAPAGTQPANILAFAFAGNGEDFHLVPHELQSGIVELEIWHFSGAGGTFGPGSGGLTWIPGTAETQALHELALAAAVCTQTGDPTSHACTVELPNRDRTALLRWYADAVEPALRAALGAPSFQVEDAFEEWLRWGGSVLRYGVSFPLLTLQNRFDEAEVLARKALANMALRRLNNCTGTDLQSQLRDVIRMSDLAEAGAVDLTLENLPSAFNDGLIRACASIRIDKPTFPKVAARIEANELAVRAYIYTYTEAKITTQPLELTLTLTNASSDASQGVPDSNGDFQTNIYPSAGATGVIVDITVELAPSALPQLTKVALRESLGSAVEVKSPARDRIELAPLGIVGSLMPGSTMPLRVLIAGNDMENALVTYSISGVGQISPTSGLTNADGETPAFDYSVPTDSDAGTGTVTVTFGSDQDSHTFTVKLFELTIKRGVALSPGVFSSAFDGTGIGASEYSADEEIICCVPTVLASDSPPPVTLALAGTTLRVHEPSLNTLGIDVTGSVSSSPSNDASLITDSRPQVELTSTKALLVRADVNPAWHLGGRVSITVTIRETGETMECEGSFGTHLTCASRTFALAAGTHTIDVLASIGSGSSGVSSASGRAVTLTVQVVQ